MSIDFLTGRGLYRLDLAGPPETVDSDVILPVALARTDGIERVVLRCRIEGAPSGDAPQPSIDWSLERIAATLERDFEIVREAALKSIRSERKLLEIAISIRNLSSRASDEKP
ncbi:MAG TPA: hypothetical protein VHY56_12890 [Candidatus Binataceae bacterium]|nr:hypothetical protein [Candidatus Binataceae bacterium]